MNCRSCGKPGVKIIQGRAYCQNDLEIIAIGFVIGNLAPVIVAELTPEEATFLRELATSLEPGETDEELAAEQALKDEGNVYTRKQYDDNGYR